MKGMSHQQVYFVVCFEDFDVVDALRRGQLSHAFSRVQVYDEYCPALEDVPFPKKGQTPTRVARTTMYLLRAMETTHLILAGTSFTSTSIEVVLIEI